jgi:glucose-1-phosphate cytidylyltransferase
MSNNSVLVHQRLVEPWKVTLVDTGEDSNTGGRLQAVANYIKDEEAFCFTYGDGLADVDIGALLRFHQKHRHFATVTAVQPPGRYGGLNIEGDAVREFVEKPKGDGGWINGGFFVLSPKVLRYIKGSQTSWESESLSRLSTESQLMAFRHAGFWHPMDTLRDMRLLEQLWRDNRAPWKVW